MKRFLIPSASGAALLVMIGATSAAIAQVTATPGGVAPAGAFRQTTAASAEACAITCGEDRSCGAWSWQPGQVSRAGPGRPAQASPGICAMSTTRSAPMIQGGWDVVSGLPPARQVPAASQSYLPSGGPAPASAGRAGGGYWEVQPLGQRQAGVAVSLSGQLAQAPGAVAGAPVAPAVAPQAPPIAEPRSGVAFVPRSVPSQPAAPPAQPPQQMAYVPPVASAPAAPQPAAVPAPPPRQPPPAAPAPVPPVPPPPSAQVAPQTGTPARQAAPPPGTVAMPDMEQFRGADGQVDAAAWRRARMAAGSGNGAYEYSVAQTARAESEGRGIPSSGVIAGTTPVATPDWAQLDDDRDNQGESATEGQAVSTQPQRRSWWPFGRRRTQEPSQVREQAEVVPEPEAGSVEEMQAAYLREAEQESAQTARSGRLVTRNSSGPLRAVRTAPQPETATQ